MDNKKLFAIAAAVIVVVAAIGVGIFFMNNNNSSKEPSVHLASIKDYSKYEYLAAGSESKTVYGQPSSNDVQLYNEKQSSAPESNVNLYGVDENGNLVKLEYLDDEGKVLQQKLNLIHYDHYDTMSIAIFSTKSDKYVDSGWNKNIQMRSYAFDVDGQVLISYEGPNHHKYEDWTYAAETFFIDNKTGNMYDVRGMIEQMGEKSLFLLTPTLDKNDIYMYCGSEHATSHFSNPEENQMFRLYFNDKNVKVEKVMDTKQFKNFTHNVDLIEMEGMNKKIFEDKFGNLVSHYDQNMSSDTIIRKPSGEFTNFKSADPNFDSNFKYTYIHGPNGYVYLWALENSTVKYTAYLDSNGVFQKTDDILPSIDGRILNSYNDKGYVIKTDQYYDSESYYKVILKELTFDKVYDWKYTLKEYTIIDGIDDYKKANAFRDCAVEFNGDVYSYYGKELWQYKISTKTPPKWLSSDKTVNDLFFDSKMKIVKVVVVDPSTMDNVNGFIDPDKDKLILDEYVIERDNKVIYVFDPINV